MWQSHVIDSNGFDDPRYHHNPRSMPVENMEWTAGRTSVGRYELSRDAVSAITGWHPMRLSSASQYKKGMHVYGNELYYGDPHHPQVCVCVCVYVCVHRCITPLSLLLLCLHVWYAVNVVVVLHCRWETFECTTSMQAWQRRVGRTR